MFAAMLALALSMQQDDLPPASDLRLFEGNFITAKLARENWMAARDYRSHCEQCLATYPDDETPGAIYWSAMLQGAKFCERSWCLLDDAFAYCSDDEWSLRIKREKLKALYDLLGPDAYFQGIMPCPWPIWLFKEID